MSRERIPLHVIVYGDSGCGKSTFAATFPTPMEVWHFDAPGKDTPYRKRGTVVDTFEASGGPITQIGADDTLIQIRHYADLDPKARAGAAWERFDKHSREFRDHVMAGESVFKTVVVDSVTFMELAARKYQEFIVNPKSREPRQWFAGSTDALETILMLRLMALPINVVALCHIDDERDEVNGVMIHNPAAPGRMKKRLPAAYSEFYRSYAIREGSERYYLLQTRSDAKYNASTQIDAPDPIWNDYETLWENWR